MNSGQTVKGPASKFWRDPFHWCARGGFTLQKYPLPEKVTALTRDHILFVHITCYFGAEGHNGQQGQFKVLQAERNAYDCYT